MPEAYVSTGIKCRPVADCRSNNRLVAIETRRFGLVVTTGPFVLYPLSGFDHA